MQRNQSFLAGYLKLSDTHELLLLLQQMKATVTHFITLKKQGFGVPEVKANSTFSFDHIVKEISKGDKAHASWQKLAEVSTRDQLDFDNDPCFEKFRGAPRTNKQTFPKVAYVAQTYKIIKRFRAYFPESFEKEQPGQVRWGLATANDFHRAFSLLRYAITCYEKQAFPKFGRKKPAPVRYLTEREVQLLQSDPLSSGKELDIQNLKSEMAILWRDQDLDSLDATERLNIADMKITEDTLDKLVADDDLLTDMTKKLSKKPKSKSPTGANVRAPIDEDTLKVFLQTLIDHCHIAHDAFSTS
ncbi:uncharacterized protein Z519_12392 [Cladophialophora bantiana CBS 173.52]|uniref:Uncharacterized protein n=1 Tax=Cladophialophora bantiana (strain ATCC 10958 / CBS 173.52 / CDC B-1940 / NIH 8579) TaxID=1442370 RepID=A0A0D2FJQ3_CLAB1|nr:uncharacterized protein Z519_12392 [Cladophialophora bantiana CBS 173.52]KIW86927.1 hypothetical protein Z519_12392 [Cladophialophora bantiana CBS 173.52]